MKTINKILTAILICMPMVAWGESDLESIGNARNTEDLKSRTYIALQNLTRKDYCKGNEEECASVVNKYITDNKLQEKEDEVKDSEKDSAKNATKNSEEKAAAQKKVEDAKAKLDAAKEKEQSFANRMLGGLTTAATGIGGMQLAQGISEKMADSAADKDMDAYIATMRCAYADGQSVKFGEEFVLPGYSAEFIELKRQYNSIVTNLQTMKPMLGMAPGIESELIVQNTGLYDDENTGVASGAYASRYRAAAGSEKDEKGLSSASKEARNRMIAGGVVAGVGVVGGIVGNSIINGKLGELIKESKANKTKNQDHKATVDAFKQALKAKGYTNVDSLNFDNLDLSGMKNADFSKIPQATSGKTDASKLVLTGNKKSFISSIKDNFGLQGSGD